MIICKFDIGNSCNERNMRNPKARTAIKNTKQMTVYLNEHDRKGTNASVMIKMRGIYIVSHEK